MAESFTIVPLYDPQYLQLSNLVLQAKSIHNFTQSSYNLANESNTFDLGESFNVAIMYQYAFGEYLQNPIVILFIPNSINNFNASSFNMRITVNDTTFSFKLNAGSSNYTRFLSFNIAILD